MANKWQNQYLNSGALTPYTILSDMTFISLSLSKTDFSESHEGPNVNPSHTQKKQQPKIRLRIEANLSKDKQKMTH